MRAYGIPRIKDIAGADIVDIKRFGLKNHGGKTIFPTSQRNVESDVSSRRRLVTSSVSPSSKIKKESVSWYEKQPKNELPERQQRC